MNCPNCQNKRDENKHCKICAKELKEESNYTLNKLKCARAFLQGIGWNPTTKDSQYEITNNVMYYEDQVRRSIEHIEQLNKHITELEWELENINKPLKLTKTKPTITKKQLEDKIGNKEDIK
jgi:hypothetical protein